MNKKKLIIIISTIVLFVVSLFVFFFFFKQDKNTTLTLSEKTWIDNRKNESFRMEIEPNIYLLDKDGSGIFFDFLSVFEKDVGLTFHRVSLNTGDNITAEYAFARKDKKDDDDLLFYQDNFVLVSKNRVKYTNLDEIPKMTIGISEKHIQDATSYLRTDKVSYKSYETIDKLKEKFEDVDAFVISKLDYFKYYADDNELYINYNITEMTEDYVIVLSKNKEYSTLNNIITKYFKKWQSKNYQESYNNHFTNMFFEINNIAEQSKVKFRSKRYTYAYLENAPYDKTLGNDVYGINHTIIEDFAKLAKIEVNYVKYDSLKELESDFSSNKIDFYFNIYNDTEYDMDVYETIAPFEEKLVIASRVGKKLSVNSIRTLANKEVNTISNSKLNSYLTNNNIKVNKYNTYKKLFKGSKNSIIAIDSNNYNYYSKDELSNYKVDYITSADVNYNYIIRDFDKNEIFIKYFNFYLTLANEKDAIVVGVDEALNATDHSLIILLSAIVVSIIVLVILVLAVIKKLRGNSKTLTKEDKLKYVDVLTSLKNRNYLNDTIEVWDESEIYPQTIIIIDLNNIAYVNDNYGHAEGDNVIKEAANILITNQLPNSEIIRTNGNEFLIYLVEYDEKQIVSYIKKLNKEFKELSHGFGAAIGYSMITDAIKTIDDAVNEATLDMKNNKEELNN